MIRLEADGDTTAILVNPERIQDITEVPFVDWYQHRTRYRTWVRMFDGTIHIVKQTPGFIGLLIAIQRDKI